MGAIAVFLLRISACRYSTVLVHPARIYLRHQPGRICRAPPPNQLWPSLQVWRLALVNMEPRQGLSPVPSLSAHLVGALFIIIIIIILLLLLLLWHLGVCRNTFLVGPGIYSDCRILLCCYLLLYQPDRGCLVCLLVRA